MQSFLALKLGCLFALVLLPLLCGLLPALLFRLLGAAGNGVSGSGRSILSCAAGGVFMAACLLDVVPDSLADLRDELRRHSLSLDFPTPELILALGCLLVLVLEHVILDCSEQRGAEASLPLLRCEEATVGERQAEAGADPRSPSSFRSLILTLSLSLHSVFEGLALGLQVTGSKVLQLAVAILLHKCIIAASLGLLLLQSRLRLPWLAASIACFVLMSPLGVGFGMVVIHSSGTGSSLARSVLEGVAAGTFMYVTFLEILPQELHAPSSRLPKILAVLLGFSGMAGLRFLG
ncbi:zinc transporter ZIP1-like [Python bivittatus]|uniref:Zinc transporter ZIP1-like n=1 Tax=Python bivittatus TaxID=176946 RepID=A0A9F2WFX3_PYTBI|nr:zinc transporter ZIP1-like [Python bivittatus]